MVFGEEEATPKLPESPLNFVQICEAINVQSAPTVTTVFVEDARSGEEQLFIGTGCATSKELKRVWLLFTMPPCCAATVWRNKVQLYGKS